MYQAEIDKLIELEKILVTAGQVERADYWPGVHRGSRETDIEHSYFLAVMSWQTSDSLKLNLSHEKILKYALVHDLPEVYAGDLPLFSEPQKHAQQEQKERDAIGRLGRLFPGSDLVAVLEAFYTQSDEESRFVSAMDKLVALFVHIASEETQFVSNGITSNDIEGVLPAWRKQTDMSEEMRKFTSELLEVWYKNVKLAEK